MDVEDARTIGARLRQIRHARRKSLRVVAGPAGMSKSRLSQIEVHQAAQHRGTPTALGLATWGGLHVMLSTGEFDLAQAELDSVTVPTNTPESMQLSASC